MRQKLWMTLGTWRRERRARQFWVQSWLVRRVSTQLGMSVMMRCFGWGPNYECKLYWGNTWSLEVAACGLGSPMKCARSWLIRRGSG